MSTMRCITFITILSVGVFTLSFASGCKIYYVKTIDGSTAECPKQPNGNSTCLTLYEYARDAEKFFSNGSNATLSFLAGDHFLNITLTINSTACHLLRENTSQALVQTFGSRIHCNNGANMLFHVQSATITGLDFFYCHHEYEGETNGEFSNAKFNNCTFSKGCDAIIGSEGVWSASLAILEVEDACFTNTSIYFQYVHLIIMGNVTFDNSYGSNPGIVSGRYCNLEVKSDAEMIFDGRTSHRRSGLDLQHCNATISGNIRFHNNIANYGGGISAICLQYEPCTLKVEGSISFFNNSAYKGGAMYLEYIHIQLQGKVCFENNSANDGGGAMYLHRSLINFWPTALLNISNNHVGNFGGAIYVYDTNLFSYCLANILAHTQECFFQVADRNVSQQLDVQMVFNNNTANLGGSTLYGGVVDHCTLEGSHFNNSGMVFDELTNITENYTSISSAPFKVCYCKENKPQCTHHHAPVTLYPGQSFSVPVIAVGQRSGIAPSLIQASLSSIDKNNKILALHNSEVYQDSNKGCTDLNYTVFSGRVRERVTLSLSVNSPCSSVIESLTIPIHLQSCPTGFMLSERTGSCICEERVQKYAQYCDISDQKILRNGTFWIGYGNASNDLILNSHCPLDYCKSKVVKFGLNESFLQCDHNRTHLLCGACEHGLSLVLGSSKCKQCSNAYLSLLVLFAVAGLALVFLLLACKLTVAVGTISGLIFYANIIAFNKGIFLPHGNNNILTIFMSWLNLDLGIEVCFYDGMDAYAKVLLQFVFPFYIWSIIVTMIIFSRSRFAVRTSRLLGSNPIAALTTPLLLSYAKVLRAITSVLSFTKLEYPSKVQLVWLYDANFAYLHGKHITLFALAGIVFFLFCLPYTLLLLLGHWLQTKSHLWVLSWINSPRVKFFLDAHYAPYKDNHRYWPGLLLLVQCTLLLISAANADLNVILLSISAATLGIGTWVWNFGSVFKFWCLNALEGSFILNLGLLAAGTHYVRNTGGNQTALTHASIGVAFTTFMGIVIYHVCLQVRDANLFAQCKGKFLKRYRQKKVEGESNAREEKLSRTISETASLIGSERMPKIVDFSRLREPLLESY